MPSPGPRAKTARRELPTTILPGQLPPAPQSNATPVVSGAKAHSAQVPIAPPDSHISARQPSRDVPRTPSREPQQTRLNAVPLVPGRSPEYFNIATGDGGAETVPEMELVDLTREGSHLELIWRAPA